VQLSNMDDDNMNQIPNQ